MPLDVDRVKYEVVEMAIFKRFSANGYTGVIEKRDCLFDPYAEKRSSFLRKEDLIGPRYKFSENISEEEMMKKIRKFCFQDKKRPTT